MIHQNRLRIFHECLEEYNADFPLARHLKEFFRKRKQMGSKDRKHLSHLMYSYFRSGSLLENHSVDEKLFASLFLVKNESDPFLEFFKPELNTYINKGFEEKIEVLKKIFPEIKKENVLPLYDEVSEMINKDKFLLSHFIQPDLFVRAPKNKEEKLMTFLNERQISFVQEGNCFRLDNSTKLEESPEYIFEIQDRSSQKTQQWMTPLKDEYWWDCCAASGGKSLLLKDIEPDVYLMASDNRETILKNLDERFKKAGVEKYKRRVIDLRAEIQSFEPETFDGIILDAPCTGSGTWSRTPERITRVDLQQLDFFAELQFNFADHVLKFLKKGKPLLYITCSVFKKENEDIIEKLRTLHSFEIEDMQYIEGYEDKADTMFIARLLKK